jgi:hypothetical protein
MTYSPEVRGKILFSLEAFRSFIRCSTPEPSTGTFSRSNQTVKAIPLTQSIRDSLTQGGQLRAAYILQRCPSATRHTYPLMPTQHPHLHSMVSCVRIIGPLR